MHVVRNAEERKDGDEMRSLQGYLSIAERSEGTTKTVYGGSDRRSRPINEIRKRASEFRVAFPVNKRWVKMPRQKDDRVRPSCHARGTAIKGGKKERKPKKIQEGGLKSATSGKACTS